MTCKEIQNQLDDYVDGDLTIELQQQMEAHLSRCPTCQAELVRLRSLLADAAILPKSIEPSSDLWEGIEKRLGAQNVLPGQFPLKQGATRFRWTRWTLAIAATVVVAAGVYWSIVLQSRTGWNVARLEGTPRLGSSALTNGGKLLIGDWLETDAQSKASIEVGAIGNVQVEPNSRVKLVEADITNHRLALERGTIHATIWAPPRIFFVETPSATAIDLGCAYTLAVDDKGAGILRVTSGWVELEKDGRSSIIPAGAMCVTRPLVGPGTPFLEDASKPFLTALEAYDFEHGGSEALGIVLAEARSMDSITLWHLFLKERGSERARVYDRLAELVPPPQGVTRDGMLKGDPSMLEAWQKHLNLGMKKWWQFWQ